MQLFRPGPIDLEAAPGFDVFGTGDVYNGVISEGALGGITEALKKHIRPDDLVTIPKDPPHHTPTTNRLSRYEGGYGFHFSG